MWLLFEFYLSTDIDNIKELPAHNDPFLEDEQAYDEAAYEHYALTGYPQVSYQNTRRKADIWTL